MGIELNQCGCLYNHKRKKCLREAQFDRPMLDFLTANHTTNEDATLEYVIKVMLSVKCQ